VKIELLDGATAATLAQVLPVLLLTLAVEVRRNFGLMAILFRLSLTDTEQNAPDG
jgi:hypothetical protein